MANVKLFVGGMLFEGWTEVEVMRSIESVSGIFNLSVSESTPDDPERRVIKAGETCRLELEGQIVITGTIDEVSVSYDDTSHNVVISGRDKTGDLVDCGNTLNVSQWKGQRLEQIAAILCEPFGIKVKTETNTGDAFKSFSAEQGESIFETIERLCRHRAVLAMSDGDGSLVIANASDKKISTTLERGGVYIESAESRFSQRDRFAHYIVKGQNSGSDISFAEDVSEPIGEATDNAVKRFRPLVILSENKGDNAQLQQRAEWEATVRNARSQTIKYTLNGWQHTQGLWQPNRLVTVKDVWLGVNSELLIVSVKWKLDAAKGTQTEIELMPKHAFDLIALPEDDQQSILGAGNV